MKLYRVVKQSYALTSELGEFILLNCNEFLVSSEYDDKSKPSHNYRFIRLSTLKVIIVSIYDIEYFKCLIEVSI